MYMWVGISVCGRGEERRGEEGGGRGEERRREERRGGDVRHYPETV